MRSKYNSGSILLEFLITLFITCLLVPVTVSCLRLLPELISFHQDVQDAIALQQLRRICAIADDFTLSNNELHFRYQGKDNTLALTNSKLIQKPGTIIYIIDLDDLRFEVEGEVYYLIYRRKNEEFKVAIAYA